MKLKTTAILLLFAAMMLSLSSCLPGDGAVTAGDPAGFFSGVWHGWIAPVSLIVSLFRDGIRIYEPLNTGFWYDFGFYMAVISGFGGLGLARGKTKKRDEDFD
jgi:hypothetical protein